MQGFLFIVNFTNPYFCLFRYPGAKKINFVSAEEAVRFSNFEEVPDTCFIATEFSGEGIYFKAELKPISFEEIPLHLNLGKISEPEYYYKTQSEYLEIITQALQAIGRGEFEKVVLSRAKKTANPAGLNLQNLFLSLSRKYPNAFVYLLRMKDEIWIGASPETLIHRKGRHISTLSLAGTRLQGGEFTEKEIHEQAIVTDFIKTRINTFCEAVTTSGPHEKQAGNLYHLATDIQAILKNSRSFAAIMNTLPPTPAVCGLPRPSAFRFINEHEGYKRKLYSGYLGYHSGTESRFFVNLRCARWGPQFSVLFAGGGIVRGSDPTREWEETESKMKVIGNLLL
jgi:isochorismate synthase